MASGPKLNSSFPVAQFKMNGYKTFRYDHNSFVAGIMLYINEDILCKLLSNFSVESLFAITAIKFHPLKRKQIFSWIYKTPAQSDKDSNILNTHMHQ